MSIQHSIKQNAQEFQDSLQEMKHWEKEIKEEDNNLLKKQQIKNSNESKYIIEQKILPIRSNLATQENDASEAVTKKDIESSSTKSSRISAYDYAAWDKYTASVDEDSHSGSSSEDEKESQSNITNNDSEASNKEKAKKFKDEGNGCYSNGKLKDAVAKYTQGIGLDPSNNLLYANRAMAHIKLNNFKAAEGDCSKCLKIDPKYIKAYLRRATSRYHLLNFSEAIDDYNKVLELEPWNKDAKRELDRVKILQHKSKISEESTDTQSKKSKAPPVEENKMAVDCHKETKKQTSNTLLLDVENIKEDEEDPSSDEIKFPFSIPTMARGDVPKPKSKNIQPSNKICDVSPIKLPELTRPKDVPCPPRNSRQFELDWEKVSSYPDMAQIYLESIPDKFFDGVEVEVDLLMGIIRHLKDNNVDADTILNLLKSLEKTAGFYLNLAFLEPSQKQDFRGLLDILGENGRMNTTIKNILKNL